MELELTTDRYPPITSQTLSVFVCGMMYIVQTQKMHIYLCFIAKKYLWNYALVEYIDNWNTQIIKINKY